MLNKSRMFKKNCQGCQFVDEREGAMKSMEMDYPPQMVLIPQ